MKTITNLEKVTIPCEFAQKTSFLFEVKDNSFLHLGIESDSIALVDNSEKFTTKYPVAFIVDDATYIGLPEKISEDLYFLEIKVNQEKILLFSLTEIRLIGRVRGFFRQNKSRFDFQKL